MQYHRFSAVFMQIRKVSATRLVFHWVCQFSWDQNSKSFRIIWEWKEKQKS